MAVILKQSETPTVETSHKELLSIHEAVMNPMDVKIKKTDTYTLRRVKEFILKATEQSR